MKSIAITAPLLALLILPFIASAHERQQFKINGELYEFVIGSLNEPISVDDKTGVDLSVREVHEGAAADDHHSTAGAVTGLEETLQVELIAGDTRRTMSLSPVYNTPGSYKNTFYPTIATTLSYRFFGEINGTPIDFTTACNPAGHARAEDDTTEVVINDKVTRVLKSGGFGCPVEKADLGFPERSVAVHALESGAASTNTLAKTGLGLGALSLLLAGYAVTRRKQ
ncbi:MAG: hypothetical protein WA021_03500 [Minisyncoccia bacterium]